MLLAAEDVLQGHLDVPEALRAIPASRVAHMRQTIARYAHRMQYSTIDSQALWESGGLPAKEEDAFGRLLHGVWHLSRSPSNQAKGRLLQEGVAHRERAGARRGCRCDGVVVAAKGHASIRQ